MSQQMANTSVQQVAAANFAPMTTSFAAASHGCGRSDADKILDDAVDELFSDDPLTNETADTNLDVLWDDSNGFTFEQQDDGGVGLQDDLQLGYMLERILDS